MVSGLFDDSWIETRGIDRDLIPATTVTTNACHIIPQKMAADHRIQTKVKVSRFRWLLPKLMSFLCSVFWTLGRAYYS